jgi:NADH-quinone oxidoreductase subunit I
MYGMGILKGLSVTFKHFIESYTDDLRYAGKKLTTTQKFEKRQGTDTAGVYTVQYPDEKIAVPERFRFIPFLVVEDNDHPERPGHDWCTSCGICAKVCPPQCIWIVRGEDPVSKRPVPEPQAFFIDIDICMNCGYCAEFCPFDAIKMDHDYEMADYDRTETHIHDKDKLSKPLSYWRKIAPTTAWEEAIARGSWEHQDVVKQKQKVNAPLAIPGPTPDSPYVPPIVPVKEEPVETTQVTGETAAQEVVREAAPPTVAEGTPAPAAASGELSAEERRAKREAALARKAAKQEGGEG